MTFSRQEGFLTTGRGQQKQRTREALLDAAMALARDGHSPSIASVAEAANVSTATAYRYFPNTRSLWADLAIREFAQDDLTADLSDRIDERIDTVIRRAAAFQFRDEAIWREVLRASLDRWFSQQELPADERGPVRGSNRVDAVRMALEPLVETLPEDHLERLTMAVVLVFGLEAMVVTRDALGLDEPAAAELMSWAARAMISGALIEHHITTTPADADTAAPPRTARSTGTVRRDTKNNAAKKRRRKR